MKRFMNKSIRTTITGLMLFFLMITSCNEQDEASPSLIEMQAEVNSVESTIKKDLTKELAIAVAKAMNNPHFRELLKQEVLKKRDGDYNVLFSRIKDTSLGSNGRTVLQLIGQVSDMNKRELILFENSLETNFPLAQIAIPATDKATPEEWDTQSMVPKVAAYSADIQVDYVLAYDRLGKMSQLSLSEAPEYLTAVVSENERLIAYSIAEENIYPEISRFFRSKEHFFLERVKVSDLNALHTLIGKGYGDSSGTPGDDNNNDGGLGTQELEEICEGKDGDRIYNDQKDHLNKFKFTTPQNAKDAEPWTAGAFEIRTVIVIGDSDTDSLWTIEKINNVSRGDLIDCNIWGNNCSLFWFNADQDIVTWDPEEMGLQMKYTWIEEDNGPTIKFTIGAKIELGGGAEINSSVEIEITPEDDLLGDSLVEYCDNTDNEGTSYNTGSINFYVNQQP